MDFLDFTIQDWITICVIIAQAGVMAHRLKKVEQRAEIVHDLMVEFAVQKNALKMHQDQVEKQSSRTEIILQRLDSRLSTIESHALKTLMQAKNIT